MADKPSRGLVVYGDGLARHVINNGSSLSHLHSFASQAYCGFLSLPLPPPSETEDKRIVREFLQLLDASENSSGLGGENIADKCRMTTLSERFMGMKLAVITNNTDLRSVGGKLGVTVYQFSDLVCDGISTDDDLSFPALALKLLSLLGFEGGKALETSPYDTIFVHIDNNENNGDEVIQFVDNSVGAIMRFADQGSEICSRLHMSVVMSYGSVSEEDNPTFSVLETTDGNNSMFPLLYPQQSYSMKGSNLRHNVRHHCPMLIAQLQNGVTRKDLTKAFSFKDFKEQGGMLTIPADRFIHEVAFKLWKAPKYGA